MNWFPICIDLKGKKCLVVGGGNLAEHKCALLHRAGAQIMVVAPQLNTALQDSLKLSAFHYFPGAFTDHRQLLEQTDVVIAATNHAHVNAEVAAEAKRHNLLVNVVDNSVLSNFIMPAVIDHDPVFIAITTSGQAPALASLLKAKIQAQLPAHLGVFTRALAQVRHGLKQVLPNMDQRRLILHRLIEGYFKGNDYAGHEKQVCAQLQADAQDLMNNGQRSKGIVYLIGAGPGDPELLTLKAHRILQNCDIVLYDHLVSDLILDYVRRDATKIYVGKQAGHQHCDQESIHQLMAQYAKQGLQVARLKGGDPAIFSRGGEESAFLQADKIPFKIIPGVTAALGAAATLQIPLTHRDFAHGCVFITAHTQDEDTLDWSLLVQSQMTLVFYMGLKRLQMIAQKLIAHGMPDDQLMAVISRATMSEEQTWIGTLKQLPKIIELDQTHAPALIIVGQVLSLSPNDEVK